MNIKILLYILVSFLISNIIYSQNVTPTKNNAKVQDSYSKVNFSINLSSFYNKAKEKGFSVIATLTPESTKKQGSEIYQLWIDFNKIEDSWNEFKTKIGKLIKENKAIDLRFDKPTQFTNNESKLFSIIKITGYNFYLPFYININSFKTDNAKLQLRKEYRNTYLDITELGVKTDTYAYATKDDFSDETKPLFKSKNISFSSNLNSKPKTLNLKSPSFFERISEKIISREGGFISVIVMLFTILGAVLFDKIKKSFESSLDFLGKIPHGYFRRRLFLKKYLSYIIDEHKYLKLIGYNKAGIHRPLLKEIFISLRVKNYGSENVNKNNKNLEPKIDGKDIDNSFKSIPFDSAFRNYQHLVILGEPGAGKTTSLSYTLLAFAQKQAFDRFGVSKDLLPIFIPLRRLSDKSNSLVDDLLDPDTNILPSELIKLLPKKYLEKKLKKGECLFLLDGLDEVRDEKAHKNVAKKINNLHSLHKNNQIIVTCRNAGWKSDSLSQDFRVLQTQNFNNNEIQRFVLGWYRAVIIQTKKKNLELEFKDLYKERKAFEQKWRERKPEVNLIIDKLSRELLESIENKPRISSIANNPMLLSLICLVSYNKITLPKGRAELYQRCIDFLIETWDKERDILSPYPITSEQKKTALREIAFYLQCKTKKGEAPREDIEKFINSLKTKIGISISAKDFLNEIEKRSGLLVERSIGIMAFSHLTLQEYLVALHIKEKPEYYQELKKNFGEQKWREIILLYAGMLDDSTSLVKDILNIHHEDEKIILAGLCIGDAKHCNKKVVSEVVGTLVKWISLANRTNLNKILLSCENINKPLAYIAEDYKDKPITRGQLLSAELIEMLKKDDLGERTMENAIMILGEAKITQAIPYIIYCTVIIEKSISKIAIDTLAEFGNIITPRFISLNEFKTWEKDGENICCIEKKSITVKLLKKINTTLAAKKLISFFGNNYEINLSISSAMSS